MHVYTYAQERLEKAYLLPLADTEDLYKQEKKKKLRQSCKLCITTWKMCVNTYTELLSKGYETYWFKAFKEISVLSLAEC